MREQNLSFFGPDAIMTGAINKNKPMRVFDWDIAAQIIKEHLIEHPDLIAEAGLQGDWSYTAGIIFENGAPTNEHYTFLASTHAQPTLLLSWGGEDQKELPCFTDESSRFDSNSKWDETALKFIGITKLLSQ